MPILKYRIYNTVIYSAIKFPKSNTIETKRIKSNLTVKTTVIRMDVLKKVNTDSSAKPPKPKAIVKKRPKLKQNIQKRKIYAHAVVIFPSLTKCSKALLSYKARAKYLKSIKKTTLTNDIHKNKTPVMIKIQVGRFVFMEGILTSACAFLYRSLEKLSHVKKSPFVTISCLRKISESLFARFGSGYMYSKLFCEISSAESAVSDMAENSLEETEEEV